jgi:predicted RNA-binding Zn ribbon-like protein
MHRFPCGDTALDFVGTLRARRDAEPLELLATPAGLDAWFHESGLIDAGSASQQIDVAKAVVLREAIYTLVAARLEGRAQDPTAVAVVNDAARRPSSIPELTPSGRRVTATPEQALSSIARVAVAILGGPDADLLKECGRPECTQVYLDRSRGSRREWCAMETCGNKMKAAAYRARKRGNPPVRRVAAAGR